MELVQEVGKKLGDAVALVGKNYLAALVSEAFVPALEDGIAQLQEDVKDALGKKEETHADKLAFDPDEKQPDVFYVNTTEVKRIDPGFGDRFLAYETWVVRIGTSERETLEGKKERAFYVNGQHFLVRYNQLRKVESLIKKDYKGPVPAFPGTYEFGGTCCFCITKQPGDLKAHETAVHEWFHGLFSQAPYSPAVASHFRCGDNWETQQAAKRVFFTAIQGCLDEIGVSWKPDLEPFDELEAVNELLKAYVTEKLLGPILENVDGQNLPGPAKNALRDRVRGAISSAVDGATSGFGPLQVVAAKAGEVATQKMRDNAEDIIKKLMPMIKKVVEKVQEVMKKKAEEKEKEKKEEEGSEEKEEKDKKVEIGDIVAEWKYQLTPTGKSFYENLTSMAPAKAVQTWNDDIVSRLKAAVRGPVEAFLTAFSHRGLRGPYMNYWIEWEIRWYTRKVTEFILEITTLDGLLVGAEKLAAAATSLEEDAVKLAGKKDELNAHIEKVSAALWKALADQALTIWQNIWKLSDAISTCWSGLPEAVTEPWFELLSHIFEVQVKAFNSIRILFCRKLKESLPECGDADAVTAATRAALRDAIFESITPMVADQWTNVFETLLVSVKEYLTYRFDQDLWPDLSKGLEEIQSLIPDELQTMGVQIVPIAHKLSIVLINIGVKWGVTKIGLLLEQHLFGQEAPAASE